jgi:hypothetical protein
MALIAGALPVWGTVVIAVGAALVSGAAGAIASAWLQTRNERREAWRSRLIDGAAAFAQAAVAAHSALAAAVDNPNDAAVMADAKKRYDDTRTATYMIDLLFGVESEPSTHAWKFVDSTDDALISLGRHPPEMKDAVNLSTDAFLARHRFSKAAHDAIRQLRLP